MNDDISPETLAAIVYDRDSSFEDIEGIINETAYDFERIEEMWKNGFFRKHSLRHEAFRRNDVLPILYVLDLYENNLCCEPCQRLLWDILFIHRYADLQDALPLELKSFPKPWVIKILDLQPRP